MFMVDLISNHDDSDEDDMNDKIFVMIATSAGAQGTCVQQGLGVPYYKVRPVPRLPAFGDYHYSWSRPP